MKPPDVRSQICPVKMRNLLNSRSHTDGFHVVSALSKDQIIFAFLVTTGDLRDAIHNLEYIREEVKAMFRSKDE